MKLKRLEIAAPYFATADKNDLDGFIEFEGNAGKVTIQLTQEHLKGILAVVADALVVASKEVAEELTANIIENASSNLLEAPDGE
jgi:hypothetical protein